LDLTAIEESLGLIVGGLFAALLVVTELGYRFGRWRRGDDGEESTSTRTTIEGGLLALLGLLLAFTFSMSVARFDQRKALVLDEANALGTAYLRTGFLPEAERAESRALLRHYLDVRLGLYLGGYDPQRFAAALAETDETQTRLWRLASQAAAADPRSVPVGLYVAALNEVIDLHESRVTAAFNRVPGIVLVVLSLLAIGGVWNLGYFCGIARSRNLVSTTVFSVLIALVIAVIIDLDRPREGFIRVGQQPLLDVRAAMQRDGP
jgi:hypothetical protein